MDKEVLASKIELCKIIKKHIKDNKIKHREICEKTGKVQSWVSKVMNGKVHNVSYDAILEFAKELGFNFNLDIKEPVNFKTLEKEGTATGAGFVWDEHKINL